MFVLIITCLMLLQTPSFKETQLKHSRVKAAYDEKLKTVQNLFTSKNLAFQNFNMFLRAFKQEQKLEIWVKPAGKNTYSLLHTYNFCSSSGTAGPKRKEGDLQIPEGIYYINHFNPQSNFHLSLGINYPNASDKILSDPKSPGSAIYIHGNCVTIGCIPITDDKIKELYVLAVEAKSNGQEKIPVHIFPSRLDDQSFAALQQAHGANNKLFWGQLKTIYQDFETNKALKQISVNKKGEYVINN